MRSPFLLLIACLFSLSGCNVGWERPNTTQHEFVQDRYSCEKEAATLYPAVIVEHTVGGGQQTPVFTNCSSSRFGNSVDTSCTTTPSSYTPPSTYSSDANSGNRDDAFRSCMNAKGYVWKMEFKKPKSDYSSSNDTPYLLKTQTASMATIKPILQPQSGKTCLSNYLFSRGGEEVYKRIDNGTPTEYIWQAEIDDWIARLPDKKFEEYSEECLSLDSGKVNLAKGLRDFLAMHYRHKKK